MYWHSKAGLDREISREERNNIKQELKALAIGDISLFMESLAPEFLTILRTEYVQNIVCGLLYLCNDAAVTFFVSSQRDA